MSPPVMRRERKEGGAVRAVAFWAALLGFITSQGVCPPVSSVLRILDWLMNLVCNLMAAVIETVLSIILSWLAIILTILLT